MLQSKKIMKKIYLILVVFSVLQSFGQETEKTSTTITTTATTVSSETNKPNIFTKKHEVKIGSIKMLAGPIFEGTYEYIYSKDFTFGSSIQINLNNESYSNEEFSITPFS